LRDIIDAKPTIYEEVEEKKEWKDSMIKEYQSIINNYVWDVVLRPKEKTFFSSKWIYKMKNGSNGSIEKYKERLMARDFSQKEEIYYEDKFSLVARYTILAIVVVKKWKVHQMDMKTSFMNGVIEEELYVEKPQGFETHDMKTHVSKLKKSFYGLKKEFRAWCG
jgi:hypothetical protein